MLHTGYNTPQTEVAYVIKGPHVALAVRVINLCELVRSSSIKDRGKYYCLFVAQGGAVAAQWRRSGGAMASFYYWSRGSPIQ